MMISGNLQIHGQTITNENLVNCDLLQSVSKNLRINEWRFLGRTLGLTETELDEVEHDYCSKGLAEIRFQMLLRWKEKFGIKATDQFLKEALFKVHSNENDQIYFPRNNDNEMHIRPVFSEERISECGEIIRDYLSKKYNRLKLTNDFLTPPKDFFIKEQYVELGLSMFKPNGMFQGDIYKIEEIFNGFDENTVNGSLKKILIEGDPGYGKTALCLKLASDWSYGKEYMTNKFDLVFYFNLKYFNGDLKKHLLEEIKEIEDVTEYEKLEIINRHRILFILDDFHELNEDMKSKLSYVLNEKNFSQVTFVLLTVIDGIKVCYSKEAVKNLPTSTTLSAHFDHSFWQIRFQIKGIAQQNLKVYFAKNNTGNDGLYFKDPVIVEQTCNHIFIFDYNIDYVPYYYSPLYLFVLGKLIEKNASENAHTRTEMFMYIFNALVKRQMIRNNQLDRRVKVNLFDNEDIFSSHYRLLLLQFGKLALIKLYVKKTFLYERRNLFSL